MISDKIRTHHPERKAILYIRHRPPRNGQGRHRSPRSRTNRVRPNDRARHIAARCSPGCAEPDEPTIGSILEHDPSFENCFTPFIRGLVFRSRFITTSADKSAWAASRPIKHPRRNLQPSLRSKGRMAWSSGAISPLRTWSAKPARWTPRSVWRSMRLGRCCGTGPVGVVKPLCTIPIGPTRSSAAGHSTRPMLRRQTRRNWRRSQTQNPPLAKPPPVPAKRGHLLQRARHIGRVMKPRLKCSITSNTFTMLNAGTRQSATEAPWSSGCRRD